MVLVTKDVVLKEMGVVPGELKYDFYIKEVYDRGAIYTPVTVETLKEALSK